MEKVFDWILGNLKPFYSFRALSSWLFLFILVSPAVKSFYDFFALFVQPEYFPFIYGGLIALFLLYWCLGRFRLPRYKKNKINIVVSIDTEFDPAAELLKKDLLDSLQKNFTDSGMKNEVHIINLPTHFAQKVKDADVVRTMNKRVKSHVWIWGNARKRNGNIYLDLNGYVIHAPVSRKFSEQFGKDFRSTLAPRFIVSEDLSFHLSELTGEMIYYTTQYVSGVAAFISGDPDLCIRLHTLLRERIRARSTGPLPDNLIFILGKLPITLSDAYTAKGIRQFKIQHYKESYKEVKNALRIHPNSYSALILRSVLEFTFDKNPEASLTTLVEAERRTKSDITWKYNRTFLHLWINDFPGAVKLCKSLMRHAHAMDMGLAKQAQQFTEELLQKDDTKPQLHFWLGFLYYKKSVNLPEALVNLEKFVSLADESMQVLVDEAHLWIEEIKTAMKIV